MQSDAVAFGIDNHGAKTVRPNLLFLLQNFSAVPAHRFDCIVEPAFHREINQGPGLRRFVITAGTVAANAQTTRCILLTSRPSTAE